MPKKKLERYAENTTFDNFFQPSYKKIINDFYLKGNWNKDFFKNKNPIVLELGCGKGEYTVGLSEVNPDVNYIGIDIKGARMWAGCKASNEKGIKNVAFLRTHITLINWFFGPEEVNEIWIPFPDPQLKKTKIKKRLTSPRFLNFYSKLLKPNAIIHLKTDNVTFYEYTLEVIHHEGHKLLYSTYDLHHSGLKEDVVTVQTFYEKVFLKQDIPICYLQFYLNNG